MRNYYSDSESNIYFNGRKNSLLLAYRALFFLFWNKWGCNCSVDIPAYTNASLCPSGDACAALAGRPETWRCLGPTGTSRGAGHSGGVSRTGNQASNCLSFTCWFLLLLQQGAIYVGEYWFSSNPQKKKTRFPWRMLVMWIRNTWSSLGPRSCPTLCCLPRLHTAQREKLGPLS